MRQAVIARFIPVLTALAGAVALAAWLAPAPAELGRRVALTGEEGLEPAGIDRHEDAATRPSPAGPVNAPPTGVLTVGDGTGGLSESSWPNFRGPNYDAISPQAVKLARTWPAEGPKALWSIAVGEGYAGAAIDRGKVYVLDYDMAAQADALRCLSLDDGREIWRYAYPVKIKRYHGMSRTIPAVRDGHVVALGPKCHVTCLAADSGQFRWAIDLVQEYGAKVPEWYAGQCPIIDGGRAIIAPAGPEVLMMAVDCQSGDVVWRTPNTVGWNMTHASITPTEFAGRRMYVYCGSGGVAGVSAQDGSLLWHTDAWRVENATVASPVPVGDGKLFFCGGYGSGAAMLQLKEAGGKLSADVVFRVEPKVFASEQQTPILYGGHLYGVLMNDANEKAFQLACLDLSGRQAWTSGRDNQFGKGPYIMADGMMFLLNDRGVLSLAEVGPEGFTLVARARVLRGHESWGPMAIADGRLIVRDLTTMTCLDVSEEGNR